jgi:transposase
MAPPKKNQPVPLALPADTSHNERLDLAVEAMISSGINPDTGYTNLSTRDAATLYGVSPSTLNARFNQKHQSRQEAHAAQQRLTPAQEAVVARFAKEAASRGIPLTRRTLRETAEAICEGPLGVHWVDRFLEHHPDLKLKNTQSLKSCRACALNANVVGDFFEKLAEVIEKYDIAPENIYNMDEKGIQLGQGQKVKAVVDRDLQTVYHVHEGSREMVTILETVCADGSALPPMTVFPAKRHNLAWAEGNTCNSRCVYNLMRQQLLLTVF